MKRTITLFLVLAMLLISGCTAGPEATEPSTVPATQAPTQAPTEPTEAPTEPATEAPTEAPTEPTEPINPLTGEALDAPLESRVFAVSINNVGAAIPHYGVSQADLFFEMFVNDYCTRGLALYADVTEAEAIGSVRSLRYNFTDICQAYDAIVVHASGSEQVLNDRAASGVPNLSVESEAADYYFRDQDRRNAGYAWEHTLFVKGPQMVDYAAAKGIRVTHTPATGYGLYFTEDATPAEGESASTIVIELIHDGIKKTTTMQYVEDAGMYQFHQYGKAMVDGYTGAPELFENVIVMFCNVYNDSVYHVADLTDSGKGYFACNGKIIPIRWNRESDSDTFHFTLTDGTPLEMGIGSSYIAIAPMTSNVLYE